MTLEPTSLELRLEVHMFLVLFGAGLGLVIGLLGAGVMGGVLGVMAGCLFGLLWSSVRPTTARPTAGTTPSLERERLICMVRGQAAECVLARDRVTGRWLDVEECSLCRPKTDVRCEKRCLILMNDAAPTPRRRAVIETGAGV